MEKLVHTLAEFEAEAAHFSEKLASSQRATLVTLSGELGAGKTAFTKVVARSFGIEETVTSPTFVLEKIYQLSADKPFKKLVHIDAYRLESGADLSLLGFDELMQDARTLVLLEWPEKVVSALPTPVVHISITAHDDGSRTIMYG